MNKNRVSSAPDLIIRSGAEAQQPSREYNDSSLDGVGAHVKLLLKIIEEHKDATNNNRNDGKKMLRVATMMTILENVRFKIQSSHQFQVKRAETDHIKLSSSNSDVHQKDDDDHHNDEEREKLRKALNSSLAARRSLETFCTSLGKEKDIMSTELSKKVNLMNGMEEFVRELEAENQSLSDKVRECVFMHTPEELGTHDVVRAAANNNNNNIDIMELQERNKALFKHLQCTRDKYQSIKNNKKELQDQNTTICAQMDEIRGELKAGLQRLNGLKQNTIASDEIEQLEHVFECFQRTVLNKAKGKEKCIC